MAFYKHDFHYDEGEHKQEIERIRQQQSIQKEWLDQQIAEKARLNQEGRRDGRVNHEEYEQFEERRIARFKYNLIRRIIENWSSVTSFDWAEANQLAQVDPKFKEALDAAKADHDAKERNKAQRQEQLQRMQIERLEKDKEGPRNRNRDLEFDIDDPYSKLINANKLNNAQQSQFSGANEVIQPVQDQEPARTFSRDNQEKSNTHKVVTLPPLRTANVRTEAPISTQTAQAPTQAPMQSGRHVQGAGTGAEHYPAYNAPMGMGYAVHPPPVYLPQQPHPVQIITTPQPNNSEMKALLEILQEQKKSIMQNDSDTQVEKMFEYFKTKLQDIIVSNEKSIEAAICDGVRRELEDKLSDLRLLMNGIEQKRLESQEKKKRPTHTIKQEQQDQVDAGTSMSPKGCSCSEREITIKQAPIPQSPEANMQQNHPHNARSVHNSHDVYKYQQLSLNDSIDKIVAVLKKRNADRMVALNTKDVTRERARSPPERERPIPLHTPTAIAAPAVPEEGITNQQTLNAGLKSVLDHLNELEKGNLDSLGQKAEHSGLLSATEFINRVLQDLKDSDNSNAHS